MDVSGELHLDVVGGCAARTACARMATHAMQTHTRVPEPPRDPARMQCLLPGGGARRQDDHEVFKQRLAPNGQKINDAELHDVHTTKKTEIPENPLNPDGTAQCLTCYGAGDTPNQCCNTCDEVRRARTEPGRHWLPRFAGLRGAVGAHYQPADPCRGPLCRCLPRSAPRTGQRAGR
jgi:hypothetical protein